MQRRDRLGHGVLDSRRNADERDPSGRQHRARHRGSDARAERSRSLGPKLEILAEPLLDGGARIGRAEPDYGNDAGRLGGRQRAVEKEALKALRVRKSDPGGETARRVGPVDENGERRRHFQARASRWKRSAMSRVTGPSAPSPMIRPSTCLMYTTSAAVPLKKASCAVYTS